MDVEKFYELLFKLYSEKENVKIDYKIFLKQNVSNS